MPDTVTNEIVTLVKNALKREFLTISLFVVEMQMFSGSSEVITLVAYVIDDAN